MHDQKDRNICTKEPEITPADLHTQQNFSGKPDATLKVWLAQDHSLKVAPKDQPLGIATDLGDNFELEALHNMQEFAVARLKPVILQWTGYINATQSGAYVFASNLRLSSRYPNHAYVYSTWYQLLIDNNIVTEIEGEDLKSDNPLPKAVTITLKPGQHQITVWLSVTWRAEMLEAGYQLNPWAVGADLQWRPPGASALVALSPKQLLSD